MKTKFFSIFMICLILINCSSKVNIDKIKQNPRQYVGKEVTVEGEVTDFFSLPFLKYYTIKDSTSSIYVITDKPMPTKGERLKIKAKVQYFTIGTKQVISLKEE